jgi:hypothetical protein
MKKFMQLVMLSAALFTNFGIFGISWQDHLSHILSAFGEKYKEDPVVQAILKRDDAKLKVLAIDQKKRLRVEVEEPQEHLKAICECDYMALALSKLILQSKTKKLNENDGKIILNLIKDNPAALRGCYKWVSSTHKKGKWVKGEPCEVSVQLKLKKDLSVVAEIELKNAQSGKELQITLSGKVK